MTKVLIINDTNDDVDIITDEITRSCADCNIMCVENKEEFLDSLKKYHPDLIISVLKPPDLEVFKALDMARSEINQVPFIVVSGALGEEIAVELFKQGVTDYVHKDQISKLTPSIQRAVHVFNESKKRIRAEEATERLRYRNMMILESVGDGIIGFNVEFQMTFLNNSAENMLESGMSDLLGNNILHICEGNGDGIVMRTVREVIASGNGVKDIRGSLLRSDGKPFPAEFTCNPMKENNVVIGAVMTFRDISSLLSAEKEMNENYKKVRKITYEVIHAMGFALESRDPYTAGHQKRVAVLAVMIAVEMNLPENTIQGLDLASVVHDIGKISVPAEILTKPSLLTAAEKMMMMEHPLVGYNILRWIEFSWPIAEIVYQHHERIDGSGYPRGLKGDQILLEAKILAVADVVEAMASHRPYRPSLGIDLALDEISKNRGRLYDPDVADACMRIFSEKGFVLP